MPPRESLTEEERLVVRGVSRGDPPAAAALCPGRSRNYRNCVRLVRFRPLWRRRYRGERSRVEALRGRCEGNLRVYVHATTRLRDVNLGKKEDGRNKKGKKSRTGAASYVRASF